MEKATAPARSLILLLGFAIGVIAANLYYAQPLVALIAQALHLEPSVAGLVVTLTQAGYGIGVLLLVPLGDLIENKKLILSLIAVSVLSLVALTFSTQMVPYFCAAFVLGLSSSSVQVIVPYVSHLTPESMRGKVVGRMMSGLMLGIMLSRPIASFLTDLISWHAVFLLSACMMTALGLILARTLPKRQPFALGINYISLLGSLAALFGRIAVLRRRAIYQACMFSAFCLFWTATPLLLAGPAFHMSQTQIALFALVGVGGAISAPFAGVFADRGLSAPASAVSMLAGIVAFLITIVVMPGTWVSLGLLVAAALLLDAGVSANLVLGQRAIFSLRGKYRSRLNGLYIATIFVGGGFGSYIGVWSYDRGGWNLTALVGAAMPLLALIYFGTEWLTGFHKKRH
jgi:predicted MFS family arabinose efflux permease